MRTALLIVGAALLLGIGFGVGFVVGGLYGNESVYRRQSVAQEKLIRPLLNDDPTYRSVEVRWQSDGGVFLSGSVPTREDHDQLRAAVVRAVGEAWARDRLHVDAPGR